MPRNVLAIIVVLSVLVGSAGVASAGRTTCLYRKLSAATLKQAGEFRCHTRAAMTGVAADPACLAKAETKFSATFAKVDAGASPCFVTGDAAASRRRWMRS